MKKTTVAFISVASVIYQFSFWICLWWCQILTLSDLRQPVWYFQRSAVTGCLFQLLIWSLSTEQSYLSTIGQRQIPPAVGAIVSPQVAAAWRGVVCLSRMITAYGGWLSMDPGSYFLSSLPKASVPSLSLQVSLGRSAPSLPMIYGLWLSPSVVYLVTRTQHTGLRTKGPGQRPS